MNRRIASNPSLNLGTCLPTVLFGHLALQLFGHFRNKLVSASLYLVTAIAIVAGLCFLASRAYRTLPQIADQATRAMMAYAEQNRRGHHEARRRRKARTP